MTKHKTEESTALAVIGDRFPVLNPETAAEFGEVLRQNLGNSEMSEFDLERVRVPTGGSLFWQIPSVETGEVEAVKTFDGVIIGWRDTKTYWAAAFGDGASGPPDCTSDDGLLGKGIPGGACAKCPFNEFGSKPSDRPHPSGKGGKACRDQRLLFVLREGAMMPTLVSVPASAIKVIKKYFLGLASRSAVYSHVVTRFFLVPDKSSGGIDYALAQFAQLEKLAPEQIAAVQSYADAIMPALARVRDDDSAREAAV